jgi:hypothetical protein
MTYEVSVDEGDKIVNIRLMGKAGLDEHDASRKEAGKICRELNFLRVLYDFRELQTEGVLSDFDCYKLGEHFEKETNPDLPWGTVVAGVLPHSEDAVKKIKFMSTVSANRGISIHLFTDINDAKIWLKKIHLSNNSDTSDE